MSHVINLSPGPVADPYKIPADDWAIVNKRVCVIVQSPLGTNGAFYQRLSALPNYQQILKVCQSWRSSTFERLVNFASSLEGFGSHAVQGYLDQLASLVAQLSSGDTSVKPTFDQTVGGLASALAGLSAQASALVQPLQEFDLQMTQANVGGGGAQDVIWNVFSKNAGTAFDVIKGRFDTLAGDLSGLRATVEQQLRHDLPVVIQLVDLPATAQQWREVASLASGFVAAAAQQRQYLTSDAWQYADTPIQDNRLQYRIKNQQFGNGKCLDTSKVAPYTPLIADQRNDSSQRWRFVRLSAGFYQLHSEFQPTLALDTFSGAAHQAFMSDGAGARFAGQFWRFVPVGGGWYRLSNLFLGEDWALTVHPDASLWMERIADTPRQYFQIAPW